MKLKKISCKDFVNLEDVELSINTDNNFLLLNTSDYSISENNIWNILKEFSNLTDIYSKEGDVGYLGITYEVDGVVTTYEKTVNHNGHVIQELLKRDGSLAIFLDHEQISSCFVNNKLITEQEHKLFTVYSQHCGHQTVLHLIDKSLEKLILGIKILNRETDCNYRVSEEAIKLAEKFIVNSDLGIKELKKGYVITTTGFEMRISDMGTGAMTLITYLPTIIDCILNNSICVINFDFCSRFHPILLKAIVVFLNKLTDKYDSQVFMRWYERDKDYFLSTNTIRKENIVLLSRTTESLIIE